MERGQKNYSTFEVLFQEWSVLSDASVHVYVFKFWPAWLWRLFPWLFLSSYDEELIFFTRLFDKRMKYVTLACKPNKETAAFYGPVFVGETFVFSGIKRISLWQIMDYILNSKYSVFPIIYTLIRLRFVSPFFMFFVFCVLMQAFVLCTYSFVPLSCFS